MRAVIIGGGHAGGAAALALSAGEEVTSIAVIGAESVAPYERPSLSKDYLSGETTSPTWLKEAWPETVALHTDERAVGIDRAKREVTTGTGATFVYDRLILAMGARCRTLPGVSGECVLHLRTIEDADQLRQRLTTGCRLVVVGGGVIGLEVAATARMLGAEVTVLETEPRVMSRNAPADIAERIRLLHQERGVRIVTDCRIKSLNTSYGVEVALASGEVLHADNLLVGIGVLPNKELAAEAGLACRRGVLVDGEFRTSDPAVFAVGDLAEGPIGCVETWANAQESAERAVAAALGEALPPPKAPYFWTDQYDVSFQFAGETLNTDQVVMREGGDVRLHFNDERLVGGVTIDQPREMAVIRRLLDKGIVVAPADVRDPAVSLKSLVRRTSAPA
ncbi:MAG: FAD-dependent oxidoreductase [Pseudomonadota bacterium]